MVMTKRRTVFSLNLMDCKSTTASWEPRQQFFFCVVLTGQWICSGRDVVGLLSRPSLLLVVLCYHGEEFRSEESSLEHTSIWALHRIETCIASISWFHIYVIIFNAESAPTPL
jgi:hypothetical protein